jgi:crotonobetainyl-CoA hydratase
MTVPDGSLVEAAATIDEPAALFSRHGRVAVITLNRPRALNAANSALSTAVGQALETLAADPELQVGIITGTGRAFCAGMDLKAYAAGEDVSADGHPEWGFAGAARHYIDKPLIAAVNGLALGGGAELVLACDLVVASDKAVFALPEVKRGLFAAGGGVLRLPRQLPRRLAMELILTGEPLAAARALELGLINRVVPSEQLLDEALGLARQIAANAPLAVQTSKRLAHAGLRWGDDWDDELWQLNEAAIDVIMNSEDGREGARAFAEKRDPVWQGK